MSVKTPVRIYVLWHSDFDLPVKKDQKKEEIKERGLRLARQIYYWFRLSTGEGIPVYFRCWRKDANETPDIPDKSCDLNIIIPLVEPHMVATLPWRRYVEHLTNKTLSQDNGRGESAKYRILPVALHSTAYQMPSVVKRLNFIRHLESGEEHDDEILLTKLTEAMSLILREEAVGQQITPTKIFLSHAKADGTEVPKQIKTFIQTETQSHTFFDENDINYGHDFGDVIGQALETESAGLLVIQGDHYADRPWCRKEIRDFLEPHQLTVSTPENVKLFSVMPAVVVTNFEGNKTARTIPELGHSSCLQWKEGAARLTTVTMLREILFSSFYRLLAHAVCNAIPPSDKDAHLLVNRPPDPVMVEHLCKKSKSKGKTIIHHPGHGLSGVEQAGLRSIYDGNIEFMAFGATRTEIEKANDSNEENFSLMGEVLSVSVSASSDILRTGISDDHTVELLRTILRPLFKKGVSLLYGGSLPQWKQSGAPWASNVNFTQTFLDQLLAERNAAEGAIENASPTEEPTADSLTTPRLFNLSAWPYSTLFGIEEEAQWINTCSFIRVSQTEANTPNTIASPVWNKAEITPEQELNTALCLTTMRKKACREITCDIPEFNTSQFSFTPIAHMFIGGKMDGFAGTIPGIWEEMLHAFEADQPTYIIGATRGAAGKIAKWLSTSYKEQSMPRPYELNFEHFLKTTDDREAVARLGEELEKISPQLAPQNLLDRLWEFIDPDADRKLPWNGLTDEENETLRTTENFSAISELIERGLRNLKNQPSG